MAVYIYVDGESHFCRSEAAWKKLKGEKANLEMIEPRSAPSPMECWPYGKRRTLIVRQANFFWDTHVTPFLGVSQVNDTVARAVYFTSCTGGDDVLHEQRVALRSHGFEPQIISERKQLADQRANLVDQHGVIERAKGVDLGLTVRILEDAYLNNFQKCFLFTSDLDFLPLIQAVRRMGKCVTVLGYQAGLTKMSPLVYVPDRFVDLGKLMEKEYELKSES